MNKMRVRRLRMMQESPYCHWCGVEVVDFPQHIKSKGKTPGNAATIDHVYSRLHPHRRAGWPGRWVLSCYDCNQLRARLDMEEVGLEELRRRAGHERTEGGSEEDRRGVPAPER